MVGPRETRILAVVVGLGMLLAVVIYLLLDDEGAHNQPLLDAERSTSRGAVQDPVSVTEVDERDSAAPAQKENDAELDRTLLRSALPEIEERAVAPLPGIEGVVRVAETGLPLGGAVVYNVTELVAARSTDGSIESMPHVTSDRLGAFESKSLAPGTYFVGVKSSPVLPVPSCFHRELVVYLGQENL